MRTASAGWVGAILCLLALGRAAAAAEGGHEGVREERLGAFPTDAWETDVPRPQAIGKGGLHYACVTRKGGKVLLLMDGQPGPEYDWVVPGGPTLHPDGVLEYLAARDGVLYRVKHVP
jgi:hypothetical protein